MREKGRTRGWEQSAAAPNPLPNGSSERLEGRGGVPILDECDNWFVAAILARQDLGDHVGFLLDPVEAARGTPLDEFTFHRARRIDPGHEA